MPDLDDIEGFPACLKCDGEKWTTIGAAKYEEQTVPLQEPCPKCIPRIGYEEEEEED